MTHELYGIKQFIKAILNNGIKKNVVVSIVLQILYPLSNQLYILYCFTKLQM